MGKYAQLAQDIVREIGGEGNVNSITHCITRLRFKLKDESKANDEMLKNMDGVVTVMKSGGQYQVVIGNHVSQVYEDILACSAISPESSDDGYGGTWFDRLIDIISGCFQPFLGPLCAAGIIKGLNALFIFLGLYNDASGTYLVLNAIGDAIFKFLPIVLGYTAAKKFKMNEFTGMLIGAALCYGITAAEPIGSIFGINYGLTFLGIPLVPNSIAFGAMNIDYTSSVVPVLMICFLASKVERAAKKFVPDLIKTFFVPFFTLLISLPIGFLVIGPIVSGLTTLLGSAFVLLMDFSPLLMGIVVGLLWQVLVIFGLHWALIPLALVNIGTLGYDVILASMFGTSFAQTACVIAMWLKTKNPKTKDLCLPAIISGICGVTEPAIYGITLPQKTPFVFSMIGGAVGGAIMMITNALYYTMGGLGIFGVLNFINASTGDASGVISSFICIGVSMAVGFLLTFFFWKETDAK